MKHTHYNSLDINADILLKLVPVLFPIGSSHLETGEVVYYRLKCETGASTLSGNISYYLLV